MDTRDTGARMTPAPESPDAALVERLRADVQGINLGADGMGWSPNPGILEQAADTITRLTAERDAARRDAERWRALYRRAINEANGLTNYVEYRPELRDAERKLTAIEAEARALSAQERGNV